MTASEILTLIYPASVATPNRELYLQLARERSRGICAENMEQAVALRAAHMIALATDPARAGGTAGAVVSKREGDLSISFGGATTNPGSFGNLQATSFGQELIALIRSCKGFIGVTGGGLRHG